MIPKHKKLNPDVHFRLLHAIEEDSSATQRQLAQKLGISLGGVNYCLQALIAIGHIKVSNFQKSRNKTFYIYLLTPQGISQKAKLTADFLKRKMAEYNALKREIKSIQSKIKL